MDRDTERTPLWPFALMFALVLLACVAVATADEHAREDRKRASGHLFMPHLTPIPSFKPGVR